MKSPYVASAAVVVGLLFAALALGDPPGPVPGNAPGKEPDKKPVAAAVPPPWVPVNGYRATYGGTGYRLDADDVIMLPEEGRAQCNHRLLGQVIGAVGGGGSQGGKVPANIAAVVGGASVGGAIGGDIGRAMDVADVACAGQSLEHLPTGQTAVWTNFETGSTYSLEPTETWRADDGRYCRRYLARAIIAAQTEHATGTACRRFDDTWEIVS